MKPYTAILSEIDQSGMATVTLNRIQTHNALDHTLVTELTDALHTFEKDPNVRVIVLKSNGHSFCAGANLQWMQQISNASEAENEKDAHQLAQLMHSLYTCPKTTIALVQGAVYGGGIGLVACCHIAIASEEATFCFSEVKLGLIPAIVSPYVIKAIGERQARAYFLTATPFNAQEAHQLGLCHEVVSPEMLLARGEQLTQTLLSYGPQALNEVNLFLAQVQGKDINSKIVEITAKKLAALRHSPEGREGISAFLEKRKPKWVR